MLSPDVFGFSLLAIILFLLVLFFWGSFWIFSRIWPVVASIAASAWDGVRRNPYITRLSTRYPRIFIFLSERRDQRQFSGLPLTILSVTFIYFMWLYIGLTLDFIQADTTTNIDSRIANLLFAYRDPMLVQFFTIVTSFGAAKVVFALLLGVSVILLLHRKINFLAGLWISLLGSVASVTLLKILFGRPRSDLGVYVEQSASFPSGHASISIAFYGFLAYIVVRHTRLRLRVVVLAAVLAFLIGFSRLYLIEHYLSDVLNGYLIGSIWLVFSIVLVEWMQARQTRKAVAPPAPLLVTAVWGLTLVAAISLSIGYAPPLRVHAPVQIAVLEGSVEMAYSNGQLEPFTETVFGTRQEPTSLIILAKNDADLIDLFKQSGWNLADKVGFSSFSEAIYAAWFNGEYISAPVTPSFWMQTPNAFGFQKTTSANTLRERHHARFWKTSFQTAGGLQVYVGTASFDDGLKWGITHHIDPNIDKERDVLVGDLANSGRIESQIFFQLIPAVLGKNFTGDPFFTDGKAVILQAQ